MLGENEEREKAGTNAAVRDFSEVSQRAVFAAPALSDRCTRTLLESQRCIVGCLCHAARRALLMQRESL